MARGVAPVMRPALRVSGVLLATQIRRVGGVEQMIGRCVILATLVLAVGIDAGCSGTGRRVTARCVSSEHLLFNPYWTQLPNTNMPRAEWPSTGRYQHGAEMFEYRETIVDLEASFGSTQDRYYRRFDSVRIGHGYR